MTTKAFDGAVVARELARCEQTGALGDLTFEYWIGGGLPPPHYRSEQLRAFNTPAGPVFEFAVVKWDQAYDPPDLHQKWTIAATPDDIRRFAHLWSTSGLLVIAAAPPSPASQPDTITREFILGLRDTTAMTVRFDRAAAVPGPLLEAVDALVQRVKAGAEPTLFHQGRRIR